MTAETLRRSQLTELIFITTTTTTTTILWLSGLFRDNPGEPVPEGTFRHLLDFLVQNEDNTGNAVTIQMDCHPIQTNWCPHLYHPHHFYAGCQNPPN